nr:ABC transporter permease [Natranaerovirga hydrolytica]
MKAIIKNSFKNMSIVGKMSLLIIIMIILMGLFSNKIAKFPYNVPSGQVLLPPSHNHWLGTDDLGIDIWAQITYGARLSMIVGFTTAILASIGGSIMGILAGYYGGKIEKVFLRIGDIMMVVPELPMMIVLGAYLGGNIKTIILVISIFSWIHPARIARSKIISIKKEKYIIASKSYGASFFYLLNKHFKLEITPILMISMIRVMKKAILAEAGLAFLGLGNPVSKSWGMIINRAINFSGIYYTNFWKWWLVFPVAFLMILITSFAFLGKELEKSYNIKV